MILVDTTPLVALADGRDKLHGQALADLDRLKRRDLRLAVPVLTEAIFLLAHAVFRRRLARIIDELPLRPVGTDDEERRWSAAFAWLDRYADHGPDWADAYLAVIASKEKHAKVWTYDREFRSVWRRTDGTMIPLAVREPG